MMAGGYAIPDDEDDDDEDEVLPPDPEHDALPIGDESDSLVFEGSAEQVNEAAALYDPLLLETPMLSSSSLNLNLGIDISMWVL